MNDFDYTRASTIADAVLKINTGQDVKVVAGGTNLLDLMKYFITK